MSDNVPAAFRALCQVLEGLSEREIMDASMALLGRAIMVRCSSLGEAEALWRRVSAEMPRYLTANWATMQEEKRRDREGGERTTLEPNVGGYIRSGLP